ncbi:MAG: hypothetical protein R6W75_03655 [Smithellaceae bacterium]
MNREEVHYLLDRLSRVLLWCFIFAYALLLLWFSVFTLAGGWVYDLHARWFDLDWHDLNLIFYAGMAALKIFAVLFFLFPFIAIRLVLRKKD